MPSSKIDPIEVLISAYKSAESEKGSSLREFSKTLNIHPSTLSKILAKKRGIPKSLAGKLAEKLIPDQNERAAFIDSVLSHKTISSVREQNEFILDGGESQDMFHIISQWEFFAILNVIGLKNFDHTRQFFSRSLNISMKRVNQCLEILERNRFIEFKNDRIIRKVRKINTTNDISSRALKLAHLEELDLAKSKIELPLERKYYQSNIVKVSSRDIPKIKKLIDRMNKELNRLTDDSDPEEVYLVSCQLFPLTQPYKESSKHVLH